MALLLLEEAKDKRDAQASLEKALKAELTSEGMRNVGFPSGNVNVNVFSAGQGGLWAAFAKPSDDSSMPRYWNPFGVFDANRPAQTIAVEINIPADSNSEVVAGFFAKDSDTDQIYLMHSGKVGGGRKGVGKSTFLAWSRAKLVDVIKSDGTMRSGIAIARLNDEDIQGRIWSFVCAVAEFKARVASGDINSPEFKRRLEEFDKYNKEFSGTKEGARNGPFAYITYHGDVVQKLYEERSASLKTGEKVFNSRLIDLFVKKNGLLTEVYEVKTGVGRQELYTAIGQLLTHAVGEAEAVAKFLVIPEAEYLPADLGRAVTALGIQLRRFRLGRTAKGQVISLI